MANRTRSLQVVHSFRLPRKIQTWKKTEKDGNVGASRIIFPCLAIKSIYRSQCLPSHPKGSLFLDGHVMELNISSTFNYLSERVLLASKKF